MKLARASPAAIALFEELRPEGPGVTLRKMFGQPSAFVHGNLFFGVYGDTLILRLNEEDRARATRDEGMRVFEPMKGHAMREYLVLPERLLADPEETRTWVERSYAWAGKLPPKVKHRPSTTTGPSARARGPRRR